MINDDTNGQHPIILSDGVNRLWQHGMHEERLFHDRLNYFSLLETGLLSLCAIMYNKEPEIGFFLPLTIVALLFTLLWLVIQVRHWAYCVHVHNRIRQMVPEYRATVEAFARPGQPDGLSISKPLAFSVPVLFAGTWVAFFIWLLIRAGPTPAPEIAITTDRLVIAVLAAVIGLLAFRLRRVEAILRERPSPSSDQHSPDD
jgi:hypothetical protein